MNLVGPGTRTSQPDSAEPTLSKVDLLTVKASKIGDFAKHIADTVVEQP